MSSHAPNQASVVPLRLPTAPQPVPAREPLWRHVVGHVLRGRRLAQKRTLKDVADAARISTPYLSEIERGRKEASSEVLAAAAQALGLGLADLLAMVHGELTRPARAARLRPAPGSVEPVPQGRPAAVGAPSDAAAAPAASDAGGASRGEAAGAGAPGAEAVVRSSAVTTTSALALRRARGAAATPPQALCLAA